MIYLTIQNDIIPVIQQFSKLSLIQISYKNSSLEMIPANVAVCLIYIILVVPILYFYKITANQNTNRLPVTQSITSRQSLTVTLFKHFFYRHTFLSIRNHDKRYLLSQFFSLGVLSVTLLNLNRIVFYQIATLPITFSITLIVNDIWITKASDQQQSLEEAEGEVIVQPRWTTMSVQQIVRSCIVLLTIGMLLIAAYRVDSSLSNLGELNGLSVLIGIVIDHLAIRPILSLGLIGGCKLAAAVIGSQSLMEYKLFRQITYQQHLRDQYNIDITIEEMKLSQIRSEEKTTSPLKIPDAVQRSEQRNSNEGTLAQLLNRHSSICASQKQQVKVEDISIGDRTDDNYLNVISGNNEIEMFRIQDQQNNPHLQDVTSKGTDDPKPEDELQMVELDILKQKNANQDLYLANIWPSKDLQLPDSMQNSPKRKKHKINKKRRVMNLCGNSPYLQYLPNMLKKQQSQNKLKSMSKNNLQAKGLGGAENKK